MDVTHLTDIEQLMDQVLAYHPEADTGLIRRAYDYSARAHKGQIRQTGEPYVLHPLAVAGILTHLKLDVPAIAAGRRESRRGWHHQSAARVASSGPSRKTLATSPLWSPVRR